jgi:acyl-CoA thioester hydrolase
MTLQHLHRVFQGKVKSEWVDYNGHMGDFAYAIVFSDAVTAFMDEIGVTEAYRTTKLCTIYTLDLRIAYLKECHEGQSFHVLQQLLDADHKRYHAYFRMVDDATGEDLAWSEQLLMHMKQQKDGPPRSMPFPPSVREKVDARMAEQRGLARPEWVGSPIGIRRK